MKVFKFTAGWLDHAWHKPFYVVTDRVGKLLTSSAELPPSVMNVDIETVDGYVCPGFFNAHSHAFQFAMAGLAEHRHPSRTNDNFWSWREAMYGLANKITPEQMQATATILYSEMLRHGYVSVAEFHYLHHDQDGTPYSSRTEMSERLMAAARDAGIDLLLIPVYYQLGGFDQPASPHQRRFLFSNPEAYLEMLAELSFKAPRFDSQARIGIGLHSLRAAPKGALAAIWNRDGQTPIHIHIAEQQREVDECLQKHGARPVRYLADQFGLNECHHLVHATHIDDSELATIVQNKATVVLCPSTEGNLGDGHFPMGQFVRNQGRWSIGSDSHIGLSPMEELRWLDYQQRLLNESRLTLVNEVTLDSGQLLYQQALEGGRRSLGLGSASNPYDVQGIFRAIVLDANHPALIERPYERLLSSLIYAGEPSIILGNIRGNQWLIKEGKHRHHEAFVNDYRAALRGALDANQ